MWIENNTDKKECFRMDMVAVLIPCYNEAKTIEKVVKDYLKVLPENSKIYVYDNNSSDGTGEIAEKAGAIVRKEYQQGKGNVFIILATALSEKVSIFFLRAISRTS